MSKRTKLTLVFQQTLAKTLVAKNEGYADAITSLCTAFSTAYKAADQSEKTRLVAQVSSAIRKEISDIHNMADYVDMWFNAYGALALYNELKKKREVSQHLADFLLREGRNFSAEAEQKSATMGSSLNRISGYLLRKVTAG